MTSSEGLNVPINVNVTGQPQAQSLIGILRELGTVFERTAGSTSALTAKTKEVADAESATLAVYSRAMSVVKEYAAATTALAGVTATETETVNRLSSALGTLAVATTEVTKTGKEDAAAQSNTLRLYQQLLQLSQQSASITNTEASTKLTLARAENELAKSKTEAAKAAQAEITANRLAAGQGAPLTDQQAQAAKFREEQQAAAQAAIKAAAEEKTANAEIAASARAAASEVSAAAKEATAARAAETAGIRTLIEAARAAASQEQFSAQGARAAGQAAEQQAAAERQLVAAQRQEAAAAKEAAAATAQQSEGFKSTANTAGSAQFALYQVAYAYKYIAQAALAIGTAPIAVAESFQTAFSQVKRTLDTGGVSIEQFAGPIAVLRSQLVSLSEAIPVSFENISKIATTGNQLGIAAGDIANFTSVVARFSALTNVTADAAATYFGRITNLLGVLPSQYEHLASAVTELGVKSAATETEILAVTQNISGAVRTAGYGTPEVLGLATAFASLKIPPELARGTMTRLLANITTAVADGGPKLQAYAKVMGLTGEEAQKLGKQSPEAFFQALVKGLSDVNINGGNLSTTLTDIGIKSVRDQSVLQKLAGNYDLLANSVRLGVSSFKENTELSRQSGIVFDTLSVKVQQTKDAFAAFLDSVGSSTLGPLGGLVDVVKTIIETFTKLPDVVKNPVFAIALIVGAIAAFRGVLALAAAGLIAFRQVTESSLGASGLTIRSFFDLVKNKSTEAGAATSAAANVIAASNQRIAGSTAPAIAAVNAETAALVALAATEQKSIIGAAGFTTATRLVSVGLNAEAVAINAFNAELNINTSSEELNAQAHRLNAVALGLETRAVGIGEVGYLDSTAALVRNTAVLYQNAAAARVAGAAQLAGGAQAGIGAAETAAAGAGKAVGGLSGFLGGPIGIGLTAFAVIASSVIPALLNVGKGAEQAAAKAQAMNDAFISAVGGAQALNDAVHKDTQALNDAGGAYTAQNGIVETFKTHVEDLHNGLAKVTQGWYDVHNLPIGGITALTSKTYDFADSTKKVINTQGHYADGVRGSAAAQDTLGHSIGLTTDQLNQQAIAIGRNTKALAVSALFKQAVGENGTGGLFSADDLKKLNLKSSDVGLQIAQGIDAGLAGQTPKLNKTFTDLQKTLTDQLKAAQDKIATLNAIPKSAGKDGSQVDAGAITAAKAQAAEIQRQLDLIKSLQGQIQQTGISATASAGYLTAMAGTLKAAGVAADDTGASLGALDGGLTGSQDAIAGLGTQADATIKQLDDLTKTFAALITNAFASVDAIGTLSAAEASLGQSLAKNGADFSANSEAGRANLSALEAVVVARGQILAQGIKDGSITAAQAAEQLQSFVTSTVQRLASQGVDTRQLDFLVKYVAAIAAHPAVLTVGANVAGALTNINSIITAANAAISAVGSIPGNSGTFIASGVPIVTGYGGDQSLDSARATATDIGVARASQSASTGVTGSPAGLDQFAAQQNAIAQQAQDAATLSEQWKVSQQDAAAATAAARTAGQEANQAASQTQKANAAGAKDAAAAAKLASEEEKKRLEYLKAVATYYDTIGKSAFAASDAQNKVIVSLGALGKSIAENGKQFNNSTVSGQANINALASVFDAYGATLNKSITKGTLSVDGAAQKLQVFGAGVRDSLASAGVPAATLQKLFTALGIDGSASFSKLNPATAQYVGVLKQAEVAAKAAFNVNGINAASDATKALTQYTKDLSAYYSTLGTNLFASIDAEGAVFSTIQKLGDSLATKGTGFNNVTQNGRDNLAALRDTLQAESKLLSDNVKNGTVTATQAAKDFSQFAGGIYNELIRLGVSAQSVKAIFSGLGIDPAGFRNAAASVKQYEGALTDAEKAAARVTVATNKQSLAAAAAADFAARLTTSLTAAYASFYNLSTAADATRTAVLGIANAYKSAEAAVQSLRDANKSLSNDIATQQAIVNKSNNDYILAIKYGQTAEAQALKATRDTAQTQINTDQKTINTNNGTINSTKGGIGNLSGNTAEAIANRKSLEDLQNVMLTQIETYAKTGASTKQVAAYTLQLRKEFDDTARQAGYSSKDIKVYNDRFMEYVRIINTTPRSVITSVSVQGTSSAIAALNSLPTSGSYRTVATADITNAQSVLARIPKQATYAVIADTSQSAIQYVDRLLNTIPRRRDFVVNPVVSSSVGGIAGAIGRGVGSGSNYTVTPVLNRAGAAALLDLLRNFGQGTVVTVNAAVAGALRAFGIDLQGGPITGGSLNVSNANVANEFVQKQSTGIARPVYMGGLIGYASGGLVPGVPPSNPNQDNLLASGPTGLLAIRSREYVQPQPAVDYYGVPFMDAVRSLKFPRLPQFYAGGPAGGSSFSQTTVSDSSQTVVTAGLSAADRRAIVAVANRPVNLTITTRQVQDAQTSFQSQQSQAGRN